MLESLFNKVAGLKYLSVFSPNAGKYGPEKFRIRTLQAVNVVQSTTHERQEESKDALESLEHPDENAETCQNDLDTTGEPDYVFLMEREEENVILGKRCSSL